MFEHIDFNYLLANYGYLAIFIGCLLEGETILILGGMAAHQHVLDLLPVIGRVIAGSPGGRLQSVQRACSIPCAATRVGEK